MRSHTSYFTCVLVIWSYIILVDNNWSIIASYVYIRVNYVMAKYVINSQFTYTSTAGHSKGCWQILMELPASWHLHHQSVYLHQTSPTSIQYCQLVTLWSVQTLVLTLDQDSCKDHPYICNLLVAINIPTHHHYSVDGPWTTRWRWESITTVKFFHYL